MYICGTQFNNEDTTMNKEEFISNIKNQVNSHKDAIKNLKTTDECIVVVPHVDFGSGYHNSGETIVIDDEGCFKYLPYTTAEEVKAFTIKDARKACKVRIGHEKDITFTYKYELVDIKEWHNRRIADLEELVSAFA